jgi:hypothetical protein
MSGDLKSLRLADAAAGVVRLPAQAEPTGAPVPTATVQKGAAKTAMQQRAAQLEARAEAAPAPAPAEATPGEAAAADEGKDAGEATGDDAAVD